MFLSSLYCLPPPPPPTNLRWRRPFMFCNPTNSARLSLNSVKGHFSSKNKNKLLSNVYHKKVKFWTHVANFTSVNSKCFEPLSILWINCVILKKNNVCHTPSIWEVIFSSFLPSSEFEFKSVWKNFLKM